MSFKPNRIVLAAVSTSILLLATLLYVFYSGHQISSRYTPQLNAVMEIKLNGALAHLWLEEIMSGDDTTFIMMSGITSQNQTATRMLC